jgi:hypothetical protein
MLQIRKYKRGKPAGQGSCSALKSCASLPAKCKILCSSLDDVLGGDVDNEYGDSRDTEDVCLYVCTLFFFSLTSIRGVSRTVQLIGHVGR